jgi:hypothetical protein
MTADDPFTVQVPDATEMYDELRRRRQEGMYMRLSAMIALAAQRQAPVVFLTAQPEEKS